MSEKINQFCESLKEQLTELESKFSNAKADIESFPQEAQNLVQSKLKEAKTQLASNKEKAESAKTKVQQFLETKKLELQSQIDEWKEQREVDKLVHRADKAEEYAAAVIIFAASALEESQVAVLEAIEARMEAEEAVSNSQNNTDFHEKTQLS